MIINLSKLNLTPFYVRSCVRDGANERRNGTNLRQRGEIKRNGNPQCLKYDITLYSLITLYIACIGAGPEPVARQRAVLQHVLWNNVLRPYSHPAG